MELEIYLTLYASNVRALASSAGEVLTQIAVQTFTVR